jgi:carbon-monoxide dehydrogenase large subunit
MSLVGASVKRKEDPSLLVGRGRFVDDVSPPGTVFAQFVRSTEAHALITGIDTTDAQAAPGVLAVITGADVADLPATANLPEEVGVLRRRVLAGDRVRFVGEPVAVVVAESRYAAADAAELVVVDYEPLEALPSIEASLAAMGDEAGTRIFPDLGTNALPAIPEPEEVSEAFAAAPLKGSLRIVNNRCSPVPMEPFTCVADWGPDGLVLWASVQAPHFLRGHLCEFFGLGTHECRVIAPDVGGGFGNKIILYPELYLAPFLSRRLRRPVKFTLTRGEAMVMMDHGRAQVNEVEFGFDDTGRVHALRLHTIQDEGAYPDTTGMGLGVLTSWMASGCYAISSVQAWVTNVITNTTPVAAYRGAGRPEGAFMIERVMDVVADEVGLDPAEVRRRNLVQPEQFPYNTAAAPDVVFYDSGDYPLALQTLLDTMGYDALRAERDRRNADPSEKLMGIGLSCWIEIASFGPPGSLEGFGHLGSWESAQLRVQPDGSVLVASGAGPQGQGTGTSLAQIAADELGVDFDAIDVRFGDTATVQQGIGTMGSRIMAVGGDAVRKAGAAVKQRAVRIAAHLLEAAPEDVEMADGAFSVRGTPARSVSWAEVAHASYRPLEIPEDMQPGSLEETVFNSVPNFSFPSGAYGCVVGIERDTGRVEVERYVCIDDCGTVINPLLAEGQVHGGVAQGIAQALYEHFTYDESGQPETTTLMDYLVPAAADLPAFREMGRICTPTENNSLGAKGIGESGAVGAPPAVANAVVDALSGFGVRHLDMPYTPEKVWAAMQADG